MATYYVTIANKKIKITTTDTGRIPLLWLGTGVVDALAILNNDQILKIFDIIIPHGPFEKSCNFPCSHFKEFSDYTKFYAELINKLKQQKSKYSKVVVYGCSAFGYLAAEFAIKFPKLVMAAIFANIGLYDPQKMMVDGESNFAVNFHPHSLYKKFFPNGSNAKHNYFRDQPQKGSWRWQANEKQQIEYKQIKSPRIIDSLVSSSSKQYYDQLWAKNTDNCVGKLWSDRMEHNEKLTAQFFGTWFKSNINFLKQIQQGAIETPIFWGFGLYDGSIPLLPKKEVKKLPRNCTLYYFSESAHNMTRDPKFTDVFLSWAKKI